MYQVAFSAISTFPLPLTNNFFRLSRDFPFRSIEYTSDCCNPDFPTLFDFTNPENKIKKYINLVINKYQMKKISKNALISVE